MSDSHHSRRTILPEALNLVGAGSAGLRSGVDRRRRSPSSATPRTARCPVVIFSPGKRYVQLELNVVIEDLVSQGDIAAAVTTRISRTRLRTTTALSRAIRTAAPAWRSAAGGAVFRTCRNRDARSAPGETRFRPGLRPLHNMQLTLTVRRAILDLNLKRASKTLLDARKV
jgi:hypothetical protein